MSQKYVAYIGCYTRESIAGIHVCDVDLANGQLTPREQIRLDNPSHMCISHNGKGLYTTTDLGVAYLRIEPDGALTWMETKWTGGIRGCYISIDETDRHIFVGGYYDGRVTVMDVNEDGSLGEVTEGIFHKGVGKTVNRRNTAPHVNCVMLTPDQKYLLAVDNGLDCVKVYQFHSKSGKLSMVDMIHLPLESAPRHLVFSKDGRFLYIICEITNKIEVYAYNGSGKLPEFERIEELDSMGEASTTESAGSDIVLSPDGTRLLCSHAGANTVSAFAVGKDGKLTFLCCDPISGEYPKTIAYLPDGKHFISLNNDSGTVTTFKMGADEKYFLGCAKTLEIKSPNSVCFHLIEEEV